MKVSVPLNKIKPNPWQTRIAEPGAEYIKDLALDIARNGLLQTPVGRLMREGERITEPGWNTGYTESKLQDEEFSVQLAFGHNRLEAYRWLELQELEEKEKTGQRVYPNGNWSSMPVEVRDLTDEQMANLAWSENEKRRDMTPIERARAIQKRLEDFKWTNRQAAEALGIDQSTISNILRLLKLPEHLQEALQKGEITERQASAILVLFELPEFEERSWVKRSDIIREASNSASSDILRGRVDQYLVANGKKLADAEFGLNFAIPEEGRVYRGTCETCDRRLKNRNLCFGPDCFEAKTEFVSTKYLEQASFISGFGILDPNKGGSPTQFSRYDGELEKVKAVKCPNMVLTYTIDESEDVPGFPHASLVCEKRNNSCSCRDGMAHLRANQMKENEKKLLHLEDIDDDEAEALLDEQLAEQDEKEIDIEPEEIAEIPAPAGPSARDLEEVARQTRKGKKEAQERREEIRHLVEERLMQALREDAPGVFYLIAGHSTYVYHDEDLDLEKCYRKIAQALASYPVMPSNPESLEGMIRLINDRLANLQLEPISLEKGLVKVFEADEVEE